MSPGLRAEFMQVETAGLSGTGNWTTMSGQKLEPEVTPCLPSAPPRAPSSHLWNLWSYVGGIQASRSSGS